MTEPALPLRFVALLKIVVSLSAHRVRRRKPCMHALTAVKKLGICGIRRFKILLVDWRFHVYEKPLKNATFSVLPLCDFFVSSALQSLENHGMWPRLLIQVPIHMWGIPSGCPPRAAILELSMQILKIAVLFETLDFFLFSHSRVTYLFINPHLAHSELYAPPL